MRLGKLLDLKEKHARFNTKTRVPVAGKARAPMGIRAGRRRLLERRPAHPAMLSWGVLYVEIMGVLLT